MRWEPVELHGETVTEGVREVAWTEGNLPDAYLDEFGLSMRLPDDRAGETLYFPVVQECADGESAWIEIPAEGGDEPEHPAPGLILTAAGDLDDAEPVAATAADATAPATPAATPLIVAALVAGLGGVAMGAAALVAVRRRG